MATTEVKTPAIYAALAKVSEGMANIPKNGVMKGQSFSYQYLRADDVQEKINPLLTANKIIVRPSYTVTDIERGSRQFVYVNLTLDYVSAEDGSNFPVEAVGESMAGDDKSINKALTQAIKNAHRSMFQFSSGEPEPDDLGTAGTASTPVPPAVAKAQGAAKSRPARPERPGATQPEAMPSREILLGYIDAGKFKQDDLVKRVTEKRIAAKPARSLNTEADYAAVLAELEAEGLV